ncbi:MAG: NADH-quinone oxidoreductase subunit C [Nitrospirae bacterium]|nr:NADH-quinone oxidoreductase subunit C [Nitrospirota bacterium]
MESLEKIITGVLGPDALKDVCHYPATVPSFHIPRERFLEAAKEMKKSGARLVAEWATDETGMGPIRGFGIYTCYALDSEYIIVSCRIPIDDPTFPSLTGIFAAASRFERQMRSLMGVIPAGHPDTRPWIKHEDWPEDAYPLRKGFDPSVPMQRVKGEYQWIRAEGEGVYEIAVGPVHAGIIEPGHFRFQAVGEDILHLEERLGYVHKGIEKRFESLTWLDGARLAGRVSGDTTVAHTLAYCMALEAMSGFVPQERALWIRALLLEMERIANHLGDIGAICNDVAFSFLLYQFSILRETVLKTNDKLFGHRLMMDKILPGGAAVDITAEGKEEILREIDCIRKELERLVIIYDENSSLEDRVRDAGILLTDDARELGVVGFAARASGIGLDCRIQTPFPPYDRIIPRMTVLRSGDIHARVWVRIEEIRESFRIIGEILEGIPEGITNGRFDPPSKECSGFAVVEGWRGEIVYWLQSGPKGEINRCMVRDPSSVNWLALELAIHGNIVPDFPVCNKSFNQSYSGNDL